MGGIGTLATAVLKLAIDSAALTSGLDKAETAAKQRVANIGRVLDGLRNMAAITFVAAAAAVGLFTTEAKESEAQLQRFHSTLTMMGPEFEARIGEAEEWAAKLAEVAQFDDDQLLDGLANLTQVTGSVSDGMLAMEVATDLARMKGLELEDAQNRVTMAFNGSDRGVKKLIGTLGEGVKGHEALLAIQKKTAGGAQSMAGTVVMAEAEMQRKWGETKEKLGKDLIPTLTRLYEWLGNCAQALEKVNGNVFLVGAALAGLVTVGLTVTKFFLEFNLLLKANAEVTAAANVAGGGLLKWIGGVPGLVAAAIIAIGLLINKLNQLAKAQAEAFDNQQKNPPKISTSDGDMTAGQIAQDSNNDYYVGKHRAYTPFANMWIAAADSLSGKQEEAEELGKQIGVLQKKNAKTRYGKEQKQAEKDYWYQFDYGNPNRVDYSTYMNNGGAASPNQADRIRTQGAYAY